LPTGITIFMNTPLKLNVFKPHGTPWRQKHDVMCTRGVEP
jgi:hypothetical protein